MINGEAIADVDEVGGTGFYTGQVYEEEWQVLIADGKQKF